MECTVASVQALPKNVNATTLSIVRTKLLQLPEGWELSCDELARFIGLSRSTVRRYLPVLVEETVLAWNLHYKSLGRPVKKYRRGL